MEQSISIMNRTILAAVDDMFFASKIRAVAEHLGLQVQFVKSLAAALEAAKADTPSLLIADLHGTRGEPLELARQFKSDDALRSIPLVGFFSHVDTALQASAEEAGYDRVMPRSAFTNKLPQILSGEF
jgi:CheY-like chemotaxis protein